MVYTEPVKNVTIALDDGILESARRYATQNDITLTELIRRLLAETTQSNQKQALEDFLAISAGKEFASKGPWSREDAYDSKRIR